MLFQKENLAHTSAFLSDSGSFAFEARRAFLANGPETSDHEETIEIKANKQEIEKIFDKQGIDSPEKKEAMWKFMNALSKQESSDNYRATGVTLDGGLYKGERAIGRYQIMPSNWNTWSQEHFGEVLDPNIPANQDKVAAAQMAKYFAEQLTTQQGNISAAVQLAAVKWYGTGERNGSFPSNISEISNRDIVINGRNFPSPLQYSEAVLTKFGETTSLTVEEAERILLVIRDLRDVIAKAERAQEEAEENNEALQGNIEMTFGQIGEIDISLDLNAPIDPSTITALKLLSTFKNKYGDIFGEDTKVIVAVPQQDGVDTKAMGEQKIQEAQNMAGTQLSVEVIENSNFTGTNNVEGAYLQMFNVPNEHLLYSESADESEKAEVLLSILEQYKDIKITRAGEVAENLENPDGKNSDLAIRQAKIAYVLSQLNLSLSDYNMLEAKGFIAESATEKKEQLSQYSRKLIATIVQRMNVDDVTEENWPTIKEEIERLQTINTSLDYKKFKETEQEIKELLAKDNRAELLTRLKAIPKGNPEVEAFLQHEELFRKSGEAILKNRNKIEGEQDKLDAILTRVDGSLAQDVRRALFEKIDGKMDQQESTLGWWTGKWEAWRGNVHFKDAQDLQHLHGQVIAELQNFGEYLAHTEQRPNFVKSMLQVHTEQLQFHKDQKTEYTARKTAVETRVAEINAELSKYQLDKATKKSLKRELKQAEKELKKIEESLRLEDVKIAMAEKNVATFTERQKNLHSPSDLNAETERAIAELYKEYEDKSSLYGPRPLTEDDFRSIITSSAEITRLQIQDQLLKGAYCYYKNQEKPSTNAMAEMLIAQANQVNIGLDQVELQNMVTATAIKEALPDSFGPEELKNLNNLVDKIEEDKQNDNLGAMQKAANEYRNKLEGKGWFSGDNMSGGMKLILLLVAAGYALKEPENAAKFALAAGAITFAAGAANPMEAMEKIVDAGMNSGNDALASLGLGKSADWSAERAKYNIETKDEVVYQMVGRLDAQSLAAYVEERSINGNTELLLKGTNPNHSFLKQALDGVPSTMGMTAADLDKAIYKLLQIRGGGTSKEHANRGYEALLADVHNREDMSVTDWIFQKVQSHESVANAISEKTALIMAFAKEKGLEGFDWVGGVVNDTGEFISDSWRATKQGAFNILSYTDENGQKQWFIEAPGSPWNFTFDGRTGKLSAIVNNLGQTKAARGFELYVENNIDDALDMIGISSADVWEPKQAFEFPDNPGKQTAFENAIKEINEVTKPIHAALGFSEESFSLGLPNFDGEAGKFEDNKAYGLYTASRMGVIQDVYRAIENGVDPAGIIDSYKKSALDMIQLIANAEADDMDDSKIQEFYEKFKALGPNNEQGKYDLIENFENRFFHSSFLFDLVNVDTETNSSILETMTKMGASFDSVDTATDNFRKKLEAAYERDWSEPSQKRQTPDIDTFTVDPLGSNYSEAGGELFGQAIFLYKEFISTAVDPKTGTPYSKFEEYQKYLEENISKRFDGTLNRFTIKNLRNQLQYYSAIHSINAPATEHHHDLNTELNASKRNDVLRSSVAEYLDNHSNDPIKMKELRDHINDVSDHNGLAVLRALLDESGYDMLSQIILEPSTKLSQASSGAEFTINLGQGNSGYIHNMRRNIANIFSKSGFTMEDGSLLQSLNHGMKIKKK